MLTNKGKYGLKAMMFLAQRSEGASVPGQEIADANHIPKQFLNGILLELRAAGLVRSKKGPGGGYALARCPFAICIGEIVRALDMPIARLACTEAGGDVPCMDCDDPAGCGVRTTMSQVQAAVSGVIDTLTLGELVRSNAGQEPALSDMDLAGTR
ncbi:RrF2 family transcriptional regulator [Ancylobacter sp. SL191]|uniref:RrF2 family transcriptional regulator n=1 Tax=Ancylobacter sp. SL191 TaxID=2995166 RepID=UPI00226E6B4F|nr:Rrf2 family transcriptional regulator [Ancylobacter sp. SL191]WAC27203.1 Rrf2 family transcriptional regulator [Ancylobacter sp. SL191]